MTGTVELDADGATLLIRFPYREDLVAEVRAVPGRRWDKQHRTWRVPTAQVELVYATFVRHLFEFTPEVSSLLAGTLGAATPAPPARRARPGPDGPLPAGPLPPPQPAAPPPAGPMEPATLSISGLNQIVRDALRGQFPQRLWVVGEIVDYDKQADRGHKFFSLVEKAPGTARPLARVEACLFEGTARTLAARLQTAAADFALRDGIEIRALVRVDLYVPSGRFQVTVEDLDPSFTLGRLLLTREQILTQLRELDLAGRNRALPLPPLPRRVAVLTSPDSDGWNDFLRHLQESPAGCELTLVPVRVQGPELKPTVLAGLRWLAERAADFDVLCILRGGGSRTDLAWFDDLDVALAVARHPLKVMVGIGHQRDQSVLDMIAHSEKTPTAVAELLAQQVEAARRATRAGGQRLHDAVERQLARAGDRLDRLSGGLRHIVAARLWRERSRLETAARDLGRGAVRRLAISRADLVHAGRDLAARVGLRLARTGNAVATVAARVRRGAERRLDRAAAALDQQTHRHRLLDPRRVLARGYAVVRDRSGRVLPGVAGIAPGQQLLVQMRDGTVQSRTEQVDPAPTARP